MAPLLKQQGSLLLLASGLAFQVSCSQTDLIKDNAEEDVTSSLYAQADMLRDNAGREVTVRSTNASSVHAYWDASRRELQINFTKSVGLVSAKVFDAQGNKLYNGFIDSGKPNQAIALPTGASGYYTLMLTGASGETSVRFSIQ